MSKAMTRNLLLALGLLWSPLANAAGVITVALVQQSDINGRPLSGALLYIYQVGTVATPQNTFSDFALTIPNPWPLPADSTGRIPMFYLADGQVHARLTDASGTVQFDYPNMQVIGPSSGGGSGGGGVDPTTVASTGDVKFRMTGEIITGWVKVNGQTIGSAVSGATGRANADTQALFTYLWANCTNAHCAVSGGRGGTALADFNANKQLTLPDLRGRVPTGLDDMGSGAAGRILSSNVTSGGGDGPTTPMATGGEANHTVTIAELPSHTHAVTDGGHAHAFTYQQANNNPGTGAGGVASRIDASGDNTATVTQSNTTGITNQNTGGGGAGQNMAPFLLGSFYLKL